MSSTASPRTVRLSELVSACIDLADHAGVVIRDIYSSGQLHAIDKSPHHAVAASASNTTSPSPNTNTNTNTTTTTTTTTTPSPSPHDILDPQTEADLQAQHLIITSLAQTFPGITLVGEEGELDPATRRVALIQPNLTKTSHCNWSDSSEALDLSQLCIWIDPLDGTKEFTLGYVHYVTVLIGISYQGKPIAGIVHVPFYGVEQTKKDALAKDGQTSAGQWMKVTPIAEHTNSAAPTTTSVKGKTIWGAVGVGVHGLDYQENQTPRRIITTTRTHFSAALQSIIDQMKPDEIIRCGGAGSKGLLVLSGEADAYVYPQLGTKRWDTCAIDACIKAAGGVFTDMYGDEIVYLPEIDHNNLTGILATMKKKNFDIYLVPKKEQQQGENKSNPSKM